MGEKDLDVSSSQSFQHSICFVSVVNKYSLTRNLFLSPASLEPTETSKVRMQGGFICARAESER